MSGTKAPLERTAGMDLANEPPQDQVTLWLTSLQDGDEQAAALLFEHCFPRLLRYARNRLPDHLRRALDEEDVALSAFKSFCIGVQRGAMNEIQNRDELWKLLTCITARKAAAHLRRETRQKRGGGAVRGESIFISTAETDGPAGIQHAPGPNPPPSGLEQFEQSCRELLDQLDDENLEAIALLRLEGYSVTEIAERMQCAKRSVERRLAIIRRIWSESDGATPGRSSDLGRSPNERKP